MQVMCRSVGVTGGGLMMSLPPAGEAFPGSPVQLERGLHMDDPRDHQEPAGVLQQVRNLFRTINTSNEKFPFLQISFKFQLKFQISIQTLNSWDIWPNLATQGQERCPKIDYFRLVDTAYVQSHRFLLASRAMTNHIAEIYFRAWKKATGDLLEKMESVCVQDLMQNAILLHRTSPAHGNVRQVLYCLTPTCLCTV